MTAAPAADGAIYTCPMHPQIRQIGPGNCPICGMTLEPVAVGAEPEANPELDDMTRRFWIGLAFAAPLLVLDMGGHFLGLHRLIPEKLASWIEFALATPVVLWCGAPFFQRGWASVIHRSLNMFSLIALGTGASYGYSLVAVFAPGVFPAGFRGMGGAVAVYFEPAAVIVVLVLLGQVLELRARAQTGGALRALLNLAPKTARRVRDGADDEEIALDQVQVGDSLRVRPGDGVPGDGEVLEGASAIDESMVTGESMPVAKAAGDHLIGGTINGSGAVVMRADKVGADTVLQRIVTMVAEAQRSRAPIQRLADIAAGWFVPAVLVVAVAAFVAWAIWGPAPALAYGLIAAVSVLIIACPCALGLATPMSIGVGVGKGAGAGVLIKSAEALERMEKIDTLVIDKTGTLTEGRPSVTAIVTAPGYDEAGVLALAAGLERSSEHPLAAAILAAAKIRNAAIPEATDFASVTGKGVTGVVGSKRVALGNAPLMTDGGVDLGDLAAKADELRQDGATALFLAVDGKAAAVIAIADPIKASTVPALKRLRDEGIRIVMLTGDDKATALAVARKLGIDEVEAEVLPEDKHRIVEEAEVGRPRRRHGRGRRQRRPRPRRRRCRHRHGDGNRGGDPKRRHHSAERRPRRHRPGAGAEPDDHAQHPSEPDLRFRLQRRRHPARGRRALPGVRPFTQPDDRGARDVVELGLGHRQRATPAGGPPRLTPNARQTGAVETPRRESPSPR